MSTEIDGWNYQGTPGEGDCRKLVTLEEGRMVWVGIRAYNASARQWLNNGEPEKARVLAWRDLLPPARGFWDHGNLVIPRSTSDGLMEPMEAPTLGDHWTT